MKNRSRSVILGILFLGLVVLGSSWSYIVPLRAQADESSHAVYAAAVARGQILLHGYNAIDSGTGTPIVKHDVVVPDSYTDVQNGAICLFWHPENPDSCVTPIPDSSKGDATVFTYSANYPPLYYILVGWPSRFLDGGAAWHAMRLLTVLLCSVIATVGAAGLMGTGRSLRPLLALLPLTPTAISYFGAINPAGLEVVSSFALAGVLAPVAIRRSASAPRLVAAGLLAAILANSRPSALAWAFVVVIIVAIALPAQMWKPLLRRAVFWATIFIAALGCVVALLWIKIARPGDSLLGFDAPNMGLREMLGNMWASLHSYWDSLIGNFGWADNPIPSWLFIASIICFAVLFLAALVFASMRERVALVLGLLAIPATSIVIQYSLLPTVGMMWQGRYNLPLFSAMAVIAVCILQRESDRAGALLPVLAACFVVEQATVLVSVVHRYAVGNTAPYDLATFSGSRGAYLALGIVGLAVLVVAGLLASKAHGSRPGVAR